MLLHYNRSTRDILGSPASSDTAAHRSWLVGLMRDASRLRAKINNGLNFRFDGI
jgi:hypothetical protein